MKKIISSVLAFSMIFSTTVFAYKEKVEVVKPPSIVSRSGILMDAKSGRILWEKDAFEPLAMASTTKIMTAIVTLENGNLDDTVIVSRRASLAPKVKMYLEEGEEIKLENLLYALMLESSNDSAIAIAEHIGGTVEDFCDMMTKKAKEVGARDTVYRTPNGLDLDDHHSTSFDLAMITKYAFENEDFMKITNTQSKSFSSNKKSYNFNNKNRLLSEYSGANGVKTGFTNKAGQCFVGAAKRDDMQLISVMLASGWGATGREQKWIDTKKILDFGFDNYKYYDVLVKDEIAGNFLVDRSLTPKIDFYFEEGVRMPLTHAEYESIEIKLESPDLLLAPIEKNQIVGKANIYLDDTLYTTVNLLTMESATRHDFKTFMEKILNEWIEMGTNSEVDVVLPEF